MTDNIKKLIEQLQLIFSIKSGLKFEIYNNKKVYTVLSLNDIKTTSYKKIFNFKHFIDKEDANNSNIKRIIKENKSSINIFYLDNSKEILEC